MAKRDENKTHGELSAYLTRTTLLEQVQELLRWDLETCMPAGAQEQRGKQNGALEEIIHSRWIANELGDLLDAVDPASLDARQLATIRVARTRRKRAVRVPVEIATEIARVTPESANTWAKAKEDSDFESFRPMLERMVQLKRQEAEAIAGEGCHYDALLSAFEP